MRSFDAKEVAAALPPDRLVPALREAFAAGAEVPDRHLHRVPDGDGGELLSLLMPAWTRPAAPSPGSAPGSPRGLYGVKVVNIAPGNAARGLPALHGSYLLFDAVSGCPLAVMDAGELTARRTAAASALAAGYLARPDASRLLVLGAGRVAALLPQSHRVVRPIRQVALWARRAEAAESLAARWRAEGFEVDLVTDLPAAVAAAHIVSTATLAAEPLVQGAWLAPGSHLDLIGSFTPDRREADDDCFRGARLVVDTDDALAKSGDLLGPLARGVIQPGAARATLVQLVRGSVPGRSQARQRTVFKSVGTALADLAAARCIWAGAGRLD